MVLLLVVVFLVTDAASMMLNVCSLLTDYQETYFRTSDISICHIFSFALSHAARFHTVKDTALLANALICLYTLPSMLSGYPASF